MTAPASPVAGVELADAVARLTIVAEGAVPIVRNGEPGLHADIATVLRALTSPVSGDGSSLRDTHRAPVPPVVGWQDISTAPRDGTNILAYDDGAVTVLFWDEDRADWFHPYKGGKTRWSDVTHWMHLPADPDEEPPAASVSPGMETLQASECTQPQALAVIPAPGNKGEKQ